MPVAVIAVIKNFKEAGYFRDLSQDKFRETKEQSLYEFLKKIDSEGKKELKRLSKSRGTSNLNEQSPTGNFSYRFCNLDLFKDTLESIKVGDLCDATLPKNASLQKEDSFNNSNVFKPLRELDITFLLNLLKNGILHIPLTDMDCVTCQDIIELRNKIYHGSTLLDIKVDCQEMVKKLREKTEPLCISTGCLPTDELQEIERKVFDADTIKSAPQILGKCNSS